MKWNLHPFDAACLCTKVKSLICGCDRRQFIECRATIQNTTLLQTRETLQSEDTNTWAIRHSVRTLHPLLWLQTASMQHKPTFGKVAFTLLKNKNDTEHGCCLCVCVCVCECETHQHIIDLIRLPFSFIPFSLFSVHFWSLLQTAVDTSRGGTKFYKSQVSLKSLFSSLESVSSKSRQVLIQVLNFEFWVLNES